MRSIKILIIKKLENLCDAIDRFYPASTHIPAYISFKLDERWGTEVWSERNECCD